MLLADSRLPHDGWGPIVVGKIAPRVSRVNQCFMNTSVDAFGVSNRAAFGSVLSTDLHPRQ